ncbi:MAG: DUF805 domain-containing protein, partial [Syntrophobacterales bacterium]|nr:DUF805 domain-containing protein [Syntrophobacterales bacterium]
MKWFIKGLKHYADFSGRARRKEYWMFALFSVIFAAAWSFLGILVFTFLNGSNNIAAENIILIMSYLVVFTLPGMAVAVRRLHDVGKSGWMLLVSLIPIIGGIWLFVLMLTNSQPEENRYGPNPKTSLTTFSEPARLKSAAVVLIVVPIAAFLTQVLQLIAQNLS